MKKSSNENEIKFNDNFHLTIGSKDSLELKVSLWEYDMMLYRDLDECCIAEVQVNLAT